MRPPASTISFKPETVGSRCLSPRRASSARRAVNSASSATSSTLTPFTARNIYSVHGEEHRIEIVDIARVFDLQRDAHTPCRSLGFAHVLSCSGAGFAHKDRNPGSIRNQLCHQ